MATEIYRIDNHMIGHHCLEINGIIDTWTSLDTTLEDFKATIFKIGIPYAKKHKLKNWIVDIRQTSDSLKAEVIDFIQNEQSPVFNTTGVVNHIIISPNFDLANIVSKNKSQNANAEKIRTINVSSMQDAVDFVKSSRFHQLALL